MMPAVTVKANASPSGFPIATPTRRHAWKRNFRSPPSQACRASLLMTRRLYWDGPHALSVNSASFSYSRTVTLSAPATMGDLLVRSSAAETMNPTPMPCSLRPGGGDSEKV